MPMRHSRVGLFVSGRALPTLERERFAPAAALAREAYILADPPGGEAPEVILIASGLEDSPCCRRLRSPHQRRHPCPGRLVAVLGALRPTGRGLSRRSPAILARVAVEEASTLGWERP